MKKPEEIKLAPELTPEVTPETTPETTPEVTPETTPEVAPAPVINIPDTTKLDLEVPGVVFFKANKPLGAASYKLLEDRVEAINQKYSDKLTVILVPFSVNVEQE